MVSIIKEKKEEKVNKGITLIALVITIVILLILAGVTIATLTGENGVLNKANTAKEETKKEEYKEILKLIGNGLRPDKEVNRWSSKKYIDEYEQKILKEETFKEAEINRVSDEAIIVITKEGWVYKITENEVKYIGTQGETDIPTLEESNIKFEYNPSPLNNLWTNESVKVTILSEIDNYQIQYSTDGKRWSNYTTAVPIYENGAIYARLVNEFYEEVCYATGSITNIDKESPTGTITVTNIERSYITISVNAYDNPNQEAENSGIAGYRYCIKGVNDFTELEKSNEYTFSGLKASTSYIIVVRVIDNAGNSEDIECEIKTKDEMAIIKEGELVAGSCQPLGNNQFSFTPVPEEGYYTLRISTEYTYCRFGGFELNCPDGNYVLCLDMLVNKVCTKNYDITCGIKDSSYIDNWGKPVYESHINWTGSIKIPTEDFGKRTSYRIPGVVKNGIAKVGFLTGWTWQSGGTQYVDFNIYNLWLE